MTSMTPAVSARSIARNAFVAILGLSLLTAVHLRFSSESAAGLAAAYAKPFTAIAVAFVLGLAGIVYGIVCGRFFAALGGTLLGLGIGSFFGLGIVMTKSTDTVPEGRLMAGLEAYNHTPDYIHQFYIDDAGGDNSYAYSSSDSSGVIIYPQQWQPGLSATVKWTTSSSDPNGSPEETWHEKLVPIERYDKPGTNLNVHFLPKDEVRLIISSMGAGHPQYPGPDAPVKPDDFPFQR